jgi:hypothetical protein
MKLYIIPLKKGYAVEIVDRYEFEFDTLQEVTKRLGEFSDEYFHKTGERSTIKILPIKNKPNAKTKRKNTRNI